MDPGKVPENCKGIKNNKVPEGRKRGGGGKGRGEEGERGEGKESRGRMRERREGGEGGGRETCAQL